MLRFVLMSTLSIQILNVLPLFVGGMSETHGFNESQLGILAAADLTGASLACIAIFLYVERLIWRNVILIAAVIAFASNLACIWTEQYDLFLLMRLMAGASAGAIYALAMVAIGKGLNATRDYGWAVAGQALLATLYYVTLPSLIEHQGIQSLFIVMALNMLTCVLLRPKANLMSRVNTDNVISDRSNRIYRLSAVPIGLLGIFLLYVAQGGIWAFVERIGNAAGYNSESIGYSLAVAAILGIAAGVTAAIQGERLGYSLPLWLVYIGQSIAITLLWWSESYLGYLLAIVLYNFCWTYVVPFHMSIIAKCSDSGKAVALTPAFQGFGLAAGAAIAGITLEANNSYLELYQLTIVLGLLSLWLMLIVVKSSRLGESMVLKEEVL